MRNITHEAANAFINGRPFKKSNTQIEVKDWDGGKAITMYLFGNVIAERFTSTGITKITNAGWFSPTTKERLNGLPNVRIDQKKGRWYLNGNEWDGSLIKI